MKYSDRHLKRLGTWAAPCPLCNGVERLQLADGALCHECEQRRTTRARRLEVAAGHEERRRLAQERSRAALRAAHKGST